MSITLVAAEPRHARMIAASMRPRDLAEVRAGWNVEPLAAMGEALASSYYARAMMHGFEPLCAFGLAPLNVISGSARLWIFGSSAIDRHPIAFARASRRALPELFAHCSLATNLVDIHDAPATRWLEWLGATYVLPAQSRGGRLFAQFILVSRELRERRTCRRG